MARLSQFEQKIKEYIANYGDCDVCSISTTGGSVGQGEVEYSIHLDHHCDGKRIDNE